MGLLAAAHAITQQQIYAVAHLKLFHLVTAQLLSGLRPQGGADPVADAAAAGRRHRCLVQQVRKAGILLPGAGLDLLQLPVELPPQEVIVGLPVNGLQQSRKVYTPR